MTATTEWFPEPTPQWVYDRYTQTLIDNTGITSDEARAQLDELWQAMEDYWDERMLEPSDP